MQNPKQNLTDLAQDAESANVNPNVIGKKVIQELQDFIWSNCDNDIKKPLSSLHNHIIHYMDDSLFDKEIQTNLWILHEITEILVKIPLKNEL